MENCKEINLCRYTCEKLGYIINFKREKVKVESAAKSTSRSLTIPVGLSKLWFLSKTQNVAIH